MNLFSCCRRGLSIVALSSGLLALNVFSIAKAEGGCPPGSYPIGGQGVQGCAPMPTSGAGQAEQGPVATGRWLKTWGSIAMASNGDVGTYVGARKKTEAVKGALSNCAQHGAADCKTTQVYKNQCVALVSPSSSEKGGSTFGRAESKEVAVSLATDLCTSRGSQGCTVLYSECSEPFFLKF